MGAILDTGCGEHPWRKEAGSIGCFPYGGEIGIIDGTTDPGLSVARQPTRRLVDSAAGHGTFIAGLVLQASRGAGSFRCEWPSSQGVILENDLLGALGGWSADEPTAFRLDVVDLSFSYYHEVFRSANPSTADV